MPNILQRPGIYKIVNLINDKFYIGSSVDINRRWYVHKWNASTTNYNCCPRLYNAMRKYGIDNFKIIPIIFCSIEDLHMYEQRLLDMYVSFSECYNMSIDAQVPMRGRHHSPASKARMSYLKSGKRHPMYGKSQPDVVRARISASHMGVKLSDEHKQKISKSKQLLTDSQVFEIRKLRQLGSRNKDLADMFGVDPSTISHIISGRTRKNLNLDISRA